MKIFKIIFVTTLLILSLLYFPLVTVNASTNDNMMQEAKNYFDKVTPIEINLLSRTEKAFGQYVTRGGQMPITRTNNNTGITFTLTQTSGYNVQACIFTPDLSTILGHTANMPSGKMSTASWTRDELGGYTDVVLFFSCSHDVTYYIYGSVTY